MSGLFKIFWPTLRLNENQNEKTAVCLCLYFSLQSAETCPLELELTALIICAMHTTWL